MNPKGVLARESRDSATHPNSLAIALALDVTGSMGAIPVLMATKLLPQFMKILLDVRIPDPQVLFLAVGDAHCDKAPLQVGQFESSAELMDQWLTWTYLEGGGGDYTDRSHLIVHEAAMVPELEVAQTPQLTGSPPGVRFTARQTRGDRTAQ
jgi:hypothetical protein